MTHFHYLLKCNRKYDKILYGTLFKDLHIQRNSSLHCCLSVSNIKDSYFKIWDI